MGSDARARALEERLRLLQQENEALAEAQADASVVAVIADQLARQDDADAIVRTGLERMSVLEDVPVCALCERVGDGLRVLDCHSARADCSCEGSSIAPSERVMRELATGPVLLVGDGCAEAGLLPGCASARGAPTAVLMVPFASRHLPAAALVFVFDGPESQVLRAVPVLQRSSEALQARLETVALVSELRLLNAELDEKVAARTRALRASEERLRLALEAAALGTFDWDVQAGEVEWAGVEETLGLAAGALGRTIAAYVGRVAPEDAPAVEAALARAAAADGPQRIEHRVLRDGETRWVELRARAAAARPGAPRRVAGVVLDVTERRRLEDELRHAQKMESVGRLAGGVAHDINNLLTTNLGVSEMILSGLPPSDPLADDLAAIRDAGRRAAGLTRQLLAFSRKQRLEVRPVELPELVRGFAPMLSRLIGEDVKVRLDLALDVPRVLADPAQVEQILLNLAVNARDAMPRGGTLTISVAAIPPAGAVRLSVSDTGQGMTPDVAARVFEPFFTTKAPGKGTGLGLATVYGIVRQHGGSVSVETAPGKGARFDVVLPAATAAGREDEAPFRDAAPARGRGEVVLVVDDEPLVRRALARALGSRGYTVLEADSGDEALALVEARGGVDLLLSDVVMPGMRGPELVRAFRARWPGRPALLMSGYPDGGTDGAVAVDLQKPLTPDVLARVVREALDRVA
jgi:PAS domain S-box-containing protein